MKGVICIMATFKLSEPPKRTGNIETDLKNMYLYVNNLHSHMKYVLSAIDEENLSESILNKIGISKE